jgi:hypothetical protein
MVSTNTPSPNLGSTAPRLNSTVLPIAIGFMSRQDQWTLTPLYLGFFAFVHNVRACGKALLGALIEFLVTSDPGIRYERAKDT